ncbi:hypothetical protein TC41_0109 [Alicyclobacillus acidocaldarius subsp. acidocaldarius Tc-4-1]|uniref:Uncharacterized protein n=1 Tax=Alicyclobacillus acidocaldarius (strain Tc-4-1) TaxID=1048834 RepID=F8IIC8_ALIAT|nr:hypothetical protein TC41_0109 [Alicyclobacillus acidocaldarius subsp. acidocaldarius Tc-4-1]
MDGIHIRWPNVNRAISPPLKMVHADALNQTDDELSFALGEPLFRVSDLQLQSVGHASSPLSASQSPFSIDFTKI